MLLAPLVATNVPVMEYTKTPTPEFTHGPVVQEWHFSTYGQLFAANHLHQMESSSLLRPSSSPMPFPSQTAIAGCFLARTQAAGEME